jgi:hypothetical protein
MITIQKGDFIRINEPHRMATYSEAHVWGKTKNGDLCLAFGSMTGDAFYRLYMSGEATVNQKYVSEVWRKINNTWQQIQ